MNNQIRHKDGGQGGVLILNDLVFKPRAIREKKIIMSCNSPNIVSPLNTEYGTLCLRRYPFSLWEIIKKGSLMISDLKNILKDVLSGIAYLHSRGIVHRDIKSANILVDHDGTAVITDFGYSEFLEKTDVLYENKGLIGTLPYMSQELYSSSCKNSDIYQADIWAFACVCIELVSGNFPRYEGIETADTVYTYIEKRMAGAKICIPPIEDKVLNDLLHTCLFENWSADELLTHEFFDNDHKFFDEDT